MKFTDGNWFKLKGVSMLHPVEVREVEIATNTLSVFALPSPIFNRGSDLNQGLLEVRFSSPIADVIRVQIFHSTLRTEATASSSIIPNMSLLRLHLDCFWMKGMHWCDFEWDQDVFPDPEGMLQRLKSRDLKICVWINPYIGQRSRLFVEGKQMAMSGREMNGRLVWRLSARCTCLQRGRQCFLLSSTRNLDQLSDRRED